MLHSVHQSVCGNKAACLEIYLCKVYISVNMEKDLCFICDGPPETPAQKLVKVTPKGYPTLLAYAEAVGSSTVLEHLKKSWHAGRIRYHFECKRDLYNQSVKITLKSTRKLKNMFGSLKHSM